MSLRDKAGIFVLTKEEQRTIAFIVLMLILGLATKHYRVVHAAKSGSPNELNSPASSPGYSPGIRP